jgi:nitrate/nitrite transporter NarK
VTATTGGLGNIPVSIAEDVTATVVSILAIVIPALLVMILIVVTAYIIWYFWRRVNRESQGG